MIKLQLKSDYSENYDKFFTPKSENIYERNKYSPLSREDCFYYLRTLGFDTPHYGYVETLVPFLFDLYQTDDLLIIIYKDVCLHDGKQLLLVNAKQAFNVFKKSFSAEYLIGDEKFATTYTYLKVGTRTFGVKSTSNAEQSWQSNVMNTSTIMCEAEEDDYHPKVSFPLFSIDFIRSKKKLFAIDFNMSPTLKDTNLHLFMNDEEIFQEISIAAEYFKKS